VTQEAESNSEPRFFFSAPWEPVFVRRGDALGLRALADQFAEELAPNLSNRIRDGRWVTILAWCLARSHEAFHASGGRSVETRAQQGKRYAWLRPLELMWVARTIACANDWKTRSLAGQRRVQPWYDLDDMTPDSFGMSVDQFRAYRQTGMYGGYRLAFRTWPGMTSANDGWTPGPETIRLAQWLDGKLGAARSPWMLHSSVSDKTGVSTKLGLREEYGWWLRKWETFHLKGKNADRNTLPRRRDDFAKLPEWNLLKPLVFGEDPPGKRRHKTAIEVAKARSTKHIEVCDHLADVFSSDNPVVALLPRFSRLADAGMAAMDLVSHALRKDSSVALADIASLSSAKSICKDLMAAGKAWSKSAKTQIPHIDTADRFAGRILSAEPAECLRALLQYHEVYGGGLRWFVLRDDRVEPRTTGSGGSSRYRFRLWPLCRLAAQCGVLSDMPLAIRQDDDAEEREFPGTNDD
jgi:hypothetical protein